MKSGNLNFLETSGPLQACNGTALPLPFSISVYFLLACLLMGFFSEPFRIAMRRSDRKTFQIPKTQWSRAATTPLVKEVFEMFFPEQLDKDESKVSTE